MLDIALKILSKFAWVSVVFIGITVISFWVIHLAPGSPTDMETTLNPTATVETRQKLEKLYGLDKPIHEQYINWVTRLAKFDFGLSMSGDRMSGMGPHQGTVAANLRHEHGFALPYAYDCRPHRDVFGMAAGRLV